MVKKAPREDKDSTIYRGKQPGIYDPLKVSFEILTLWP